MSIRAWLSDLLQLQNIYCRPSCCFYTIWDSRAVYSCTHNDQFSAPLATLQHISQLLHPIQMAHPRRGYTLRILIHAHFDRVDPWFV